MRAAPTTNCTLPHTTYNVLPGLVQQPRCPQPRTARAAKRVRRVHAVRLGGEYRAKQCCNQAVGFLTPHAAVRACNLCQAVLHTDTHGTQPYPTFSFAPMAGQAFKHAESLLRSSSLMNTSGPRYFLQCTNPRVASSCAMSSCHAALDTVAASNSLCLQCKQARHQRCTAERRCRVIALLVLSAEQHLRQRTARHRLRHRMGASPPPPLPHARRHSRSSHLFVDEHEAVGEREAK